MVKISELQAGQGNVDVEGTVKEVGEVRTFNKFGRDLSVANAMLEDDSGSIKLSLWNDDATKYKSGDKIKITNKFIENISTKVLQSCEVEVPDNLSKRFIKQNKDIIAHICY
mgnify:CR=1 FL=1